MSRRDLCVGCVLTVRPTLLMGLLAAAPLTKAQPRSAGCGQEPRSDPCPHSLAFCTRNISFSSSGVNILSRCCDKRAAPASPRAPPAGPDPEQGGCRAVQDSRVPAAPCYSWLFHVDCPKKLLGEDSPKPGVQTCYKAVTSVPWLMAGSELRQSLHTYI